ncbi:MAG: murein biosynthesis integral membrane protein MurJ [Candidatus Rokubacteria bacterium]|nr:murein biosynthesis integral membrane protein MurJ [Candidatus Rokubacteria bacterium]
MSTERQVVRALGSIGGATLISRVLGFARDMLVALVYGAGPVTDAFFVAFRIPNILRRLLAEGALSTAVVPVLSEYAATRPRDDFLRMLRAVLGAGLLALVVTTAAGMAAAPWLVRVIAPGFAADPGQAALAVLLTRVMFPYLLLVGVAALAMGVLHTHGRFFAAALGPALLNLGMIAAVLVLARRLQPPILALALGVLAGGLAQLAVQLPALARLGLLVAPAADLRHPAVRRVARLLVPAVFGLAAVQVSVFVNTLLASLLPPGSISFLYYADRVMEFPLGVFAIALASAALPTMSRQAAAGDRAGLAGTLEFALRLGMFIAVPAAVGLVVLRVPIVRVLFERGEFGPAETAATATALAWYAVGLPGFSGARIAAQAFYAVGAAGTAVRLGMLSVLVNVLAALLLMGPLGHGGLALAASVGAYANLALLALAARRRFGALDGRAIARSLGRTAAAAAAVGVWCVLCRAAWPAAVGRATEAAALAAAIGVGALIFWAVGAAVGASERRALAAMLPGRRSG